MFLIDTNVMIAASALEESSNLSLSAMPRELELRERVHEWLSRFALSASHIVMDEEGLVWDEYERNMPFNSLAQEYGMQVLQYKLDRNQVDYVPIETIEANGEHIAVLAPEHEALVPDREDRKWVACALAALILHGQAPPIVYAAESDWFVAEADLISLGLRFERLLPDDWYTKRRDAQ